ncbi:MAG: hypothetical protein KDD63_16045 [Bacteroidetes bacterium]|nr:hypothetical protein [Bacteroidota bacterium]
MIQKLTHIILITTVLLSSSGLIIQKHFCQNELKSVSIYVKPDQCHPKASASTPKACPMHGREKMARPHKPEQKGCCDDSAEFFKLDTKFVITSDADFTADIQLIDFYQESPIDDFLESESLKFHYLNYKPPLLVCDVAVSLQTFIC